MTTNVEAVEVKESRISDNAGKWLGGIGIAVSVIGFFWMHIWLGAAGVVLGAIGLFSPQKILNTVAVIAGTVAIILGIVL